MGEDVKKLIDDHWAYVEGVIIHEFRDMPTGIGLKNYLQRTAYHFKTAFEHGYKHGKEDMQEIQDRMAEKIFKLEGGAHEQG